MAPRHKSGGELFIVDNSDETWKGLRYISLADAMPLNSMGIKTHRDAFVIDFDKQPLRERVEKFRGSSSDGSIADEFGLADTYGFKGVRKDVWNFHIGGYQVCEKWLKGCQLSADDRTHYHKIIVALSETIRLMGEVNTVIDRHGGWPLK